MAGHARWYHENRWVILGTLAVAVVVAVVVAGFSGLVTGLLAAGAVIGTVAMLVLFSATSLGMEQTLDRQIRDRERRTSRDR